MTEKCSLILKKMLVCTAFCVCSFCNIFAEKFVCLKSSKVNLRVGPGREYPICWVVLRSNLPVKMISEFGQWRKIQLPDGTQGWLHQSTISYKKTVCLLDDAVMYRGASDKTTPIAMIEKGCVAKFLKCDGDWIKIDIHKTRGWVEKSKLWGNSD